MKKTNKIIALLLVVVMVVALGAVSAFAEDTVKQGKTLASTGFQKTFDVPDGVSRPAANFMFTLTPDAGNPSGPTAAWDETISIATGTGTGTGFKHLSDIFTLTGETGKKALTQPGEYKFTVKEVKDTYSLQTGEKVTYDENEYTLRIYVVRNGNNLEEKAITVVDTDDDPNGDPDDAKKIDPTEDTETQDPTPDDPDSGDETTNGLGTSDWEFINYYTKNITDNSADGAFNINKTVGGSGDTSKGFDFDVSITVDGQTVAEYKDNEGNYTITGKVGTTEYTWTFKANELTKEVKGIKLKHGEKLVFNTFPTGAVVTVKENLKSDSSIQNAGSYTKEVAVSGISLAQGSESNFGQTADVNVTTVPYNAKSNVGVTNTLSADDITPEGIMINNLPYIILAILAIGGLGAYIMIRRKENEA